MLFFFLVFLILGYFYFCQSRSRRFLQIQNLRERQKEYDVPSAINLVKQMANTKFNETAEAHFRLNINPKYNDQQLRATVSVSFVICCRALSYLH